MQFITRQPPARAAVSMVELPFKLDLPFKKDDTTELAAAAHDVIIVGAGAAGVGCAMMLTKTFGLDPSRVLLIERRKDHVEVGFRHVFESLSQACNPGLPGRSFDALTR